MSTSPSPSPPTADPFFWAIVEILGKRQMAGRCLELRQYGADGIQVEVPYEQGFLPSQFYAGGALFGVHRVSEAAARHAAARSWQVDQTARLLLGPAALPAVSPPAIEYAEGTVVEGEQDEEDDGDPHDGEQDGEPHGGEQDDGEQDDDEHSELEPK